ncbi:MAG TPA: hypothetical protein PK189_01810 [bacterium]|nr:hypothetical protein [bacterium]
MTDDYAFEINKKELTKEEFNNISDYIKICEKNIKKIKKLYKKNKFEKIGKYIKEIEEEKVNVNSLITKDDYFNESQLFKGLLFEKKFNFKEAEKIYKNIDRKSRYGKIAENRILRTIEDTDKDGFIDSLEIELKTNYNNPLSHP